MMWFMNEVKKEGLMGLRMNDKQNTGKVYQAAAANFMGQASGSNEVERD